MLRFRKTDANHTAHKGFTLTELLAAVSLLILLASFALCTISDRRNPDYIVRTQSSELVSWLEERMAYADATGSSFTLAFLTAKNGSCRLRLTWENGPLYARHDDFIPEHCSLYYSGNSECTYSGEWHTLTPAAVFTFSSSHGTQSASSSVSVSGQGYISRKLK